MPLYFNSADLAKLGLSRVEFTQELKAIEAESMGWLPLEAGVYLHRGAQPGSVQDAFIEIVGTMTDATADANVLWLV